MNGAVVTSSFLAASIEAIEMVALVVVVGTARSWRSALLGAAAGLVLVAATIGSLGTALEAVPLRPLRLVVGSLLLLFGLQWLRKGLLRVAREGWTAGAVGDPAVEPRAVAGRVDWAAFVLSFKGVALEGLEIAVVVIALGAGARDLPSAALGAAGALLVIGAAGALAHRLVARIPRRVLQLGVGAVLATFGTFWAVEGAGADWPGGEAALVGVGAFYLLAGALLLQWARGVTSPAGRSATPVDAELPDG